jgi:hypothetical protein
VPRLILDGIALEQPPPPSPPKPEIAPDAPIEQWAETAWVLAQLDAFDAQDRARQALTLQDRIEKGRTWMLEHDESHPKYQRSRVLLLNLQDRRDDELIAERCFERSCITRCREAFGLRTNAGIKTETAEQMWESLMGQRAIPELRYIEGCLAVEPRTGAAPWEIDSLRELLALKESRTNATG